MLMLFARITYFDNQEFPLSKGITFEAAISFLFLSGFVLRREANELKYCVKKSVRTMRVKGVGNMRVNNAVQDEIIRRIDAIDEGAFQPMLEQPVMQALSLYWPLSVFLPANISKYLDDPQKTSQLGKQKNIYVSTLLLAAIQCAFERDIPP
ncbi:MAG TPA: hypothetical protein VL380_04255 [Nitrosospira sp.]|jgi:hypothetical protein|nr:hypothetical protein [Nitrosospira sp.]